jgi:hypothetical protein
MVSYSHTAKMHTLFISLEEEMLVILHKEWVWKREKDYGELLSNLTMG